MKLVSSSATSVGKKRKENEDSYLADDTRGLYVVCDGMGGHRAGEVASSAAIEVVREAIEQSDLDLVGLADGAAQERVRIQDLLRQAVHKASLTIHEQGQKNPQLRGMGTTLTLLLVAGQRGFVAHVGDSRLYLHRGGQINQITSDHSLVYEMVRAGKLDPQKAKSTPFTNALTRAVGVYANVAVDVMELDLLPGDVFLLCSDGLHTYLEDDTLLDGIRQPSPTRATWYVDLANNAGGKDNITAVVVQVEAVPDDERSARFQLTYETLRKIPLFQHLTYSEMVRVIAVSRAREVDTGQVIIRQGDVGDALYIVLKGQVGVWQQERCLATLSSGRHFGEMSLVDNQPRSATVTADEPTTLIRIVRADFYSLLRQDSVTAVKLLWNFIQTLSYRLRARSEDLTPTGETEAIADEPAPYGIAEVDYSEDAWASTDPKANVGEGDDDAT